MKIKAGQGLIVLLLFLLTACTVSEQQRFYLGKIDSLQTVLDSATARYLELDTLKIAQAETTIKQHLVQFEQLDTIVSDTAKIYAFIEKSLKKFDGEREKINKEIVYTNSQLQALRHDVRKNELTEEEMQRYYGDEEEAIHNLLDKMWFNKESAEYQLKSFDYLHEKIEKMLGRYENKDR
jgi:septal ring factor EnvC (AmiA/AmiB activator)